MELSIEEVEKTLRTAGRHVSMNAPFVQGEDNTLLDTLENDSEETPDSELMADSLRREIETALSTLTDKEKDVIVHYFGVCDTQAKTLEEIAELLNVTRERVRQIKEKGLRRLRHTSRSRGLKVFLG
jgi:RNA polymerase primary sigma factor